MIVKVLFFASARELAGNIKETTVEIDSAESDTTQIRKILAERYPKLASLVLDEDSITLALNEEYVEECTAVKDGDTIALIPPISGG